MQPPICVRINLYKRGAFNKFVVTNYLGPGIWSAVWGIV